jgi:hypothetical protein
MVTQTPKWIARFVKLRASFLYNNETHEYVVVDPEIALIQGAPPVFTICKNGVLAVSSDYPEEWRGLGLIHEIVEQGMPQDDNMCLEALKVELELAQQLKIDMVAYVTFRNMFFRNLLNFYTNCDDFSGRVDLVKRLSQSLDHLTSLTSA